jgi:hypothetical protein
MDFFEYSFPDDRIEYDTGYVLTLTLYILHLLLPRSSLRVFRLTRG